MTIRTKIVLVDDHPIVLGGLCNLIAAELDFEVVGQAANGIEALRVIREAKPDVAVVDISMPKMNGIMLIREVLTTIASVRMVVLTLYEEKAYLKQAMDAGARGYVLKRSAASNLVTAIRSIVTGSVYIDPEMADQAKNGARPIRESAISSIKRLTDREADVLKLSSLGLTNKEIAYRLDIGVKSIETYKARGLTKLQLKTRAELVRFASTSGWLAGI